MMADAGASIELRAKLTGHSTLTMNDRYTHLADATKRRAIDAIPSLANRSAQAKHADLAKKPGTKTDQSP
jgi:hypothetical protein